MVAVNIGMLHHVLDHLYGAFVHRTKITPPFFSRGWGGTKLDLLERLIKQLFPEIEGQNWPPTLVQPIWTTVWETKTASLREGVFQTPCDEQILSALPPECHNARVAFLSPKLVPPEKMACVVHLAGTGDHTFERRLRLGGPLLKENIATMVLESPFYGKRRPMLQRGAKLLCVSDLLLLGRATIEEARSLLYWLDTEEGYGKMGVCGLSMGGVHASMVGSLHPTPVATLPFLSPHSAVVAFCEGILKHATAWEALREDLALQKAAITLEEVRERMRNVLSLTDVTRFPIPKNPNACIFVAATVSSLLTNGIPLRRTRLWEGRSLAFQFDVMMRKLFFMTSILICLPFLLLSKAINLTLDFSCWKQTRVEFCWKAKNFSGGLDDNNKQEIGLVFVYTKLFSSLDIECRAISLYLRIWSTPSAM